MAVSYATLLDTQHRASPAVGLFDAWKDWLSLEGKSERTIDAYERPVAKLLRENLDKAIEHFTAADIRAQLAAYPPKSRRPMRVRLGSFWHYICEIEERVQPNPMNKVPRVRREQQKVHRIFEDFEMALLFGLPSRDSALFYLLFDCGLRKGEARLLQRRHISLDRGELIVQRGKGGKGRVVPLTHRAQRAVAELDLLDGLEREDYLWYGRPGGRTRISRRTPVGPARFAKWYAECIAEAGVEYRNPHTCRHTFATRFLRAGGRLERLSLLMGHASVATTFNLYAHLDLEDVRGDIALLEVTA